MNLGWFSFMANVALLGLLVYNRINLLRVIGKGDFPRFIINPNPFHSLFPANGRNNIGEIFPIILQHTVSSRALDQVTGLNQRY